MGACCGKSSKADANSAHASSSPNNSQHSELEALSDKPSKTDSSLSFAAKRKEQQLEAFARKGDTNKIKLLLNKNLDLKIDHANKEDMTALDIACQEGQELAVLLLLRSGANPNARQKTSGNRPLDFCSDEQVARWLVVYGARPSLQNSKAASPNPDLTKNLEKYKSLHLKREWNQCDTQEQPVEGTSPQWMDDNASDECILCSEKFSMVNRRHHCRKCGILVCDDCSTRKLAFAPTSKSNADGSETKRLKSLNTAASARVDALDTENVTTVLVDDLRVCDVCYNIAHTHSTKKSKKTGLLVGDLLAKKTVDLTQTNESESSDGKEKQIQNIYSVAKLSTKKGKKGKNECAGATSLAIDGTLLRANVRGSKLSQLENKSEKMANTAEEFQHYSEQILARSQKGAL